MKNARKYSQLVEFWIKDNGVYSLDFSDYASVKTKDETRTLQENQIILEGFYELYLRYRSDVEITKSHTIKLGTKTLTIHSIINVDELNKEIKLIASESDNAIEIFDNENPYENYQ
jgi:hypothetical protein